MAVSYDKKIFAANLRRLMEENSSHQAAVARLLGVSRSTLSAYCKGEQMPRMDKIEQLSLHFGVPRSAFIEPYEPESAGEKADDNVLAFPVPRPEHPAVEVYESLNEAGREEYLRYGRELGDKAEYRAAEAPVTYIKHYLVPAAAGYASPIQGEDYELIPQPEDAPRGADFCISISGDSMAPYIPDGSLVYVRRDSPLQEFDVGVFFVDGDVFCKQWCRDYNGTLHLLSANPGRQDANISISRDSARSCVCFGKVLLNERLPRPVYL